MTKHLTYLLLLSFIIQSCINSENSQHESPISQESNLAQSNTNETVNTDQDIIFKEIGTPSKYIWESLNEEAKTYTTLAFDNGTFRMSAYTFEGSVQNMTKAMDIHGKWQAIGNNQINGTIGITGAQISWTTSADYSTITNNKGVLFQRVSMNSQKNDSQASQTDINPDGTYSYHDNSADIQIIVSGENWTGKTKIISGLGDAYDENNVEYESGIVRGMDLYESSGFSKIGKIDGKSLITTIGGNTINLHKY